MEADDASPARAARRRVWGFITYKWYTGGGLGMLIKK